MSEYEDVMETLRATSRTFFIPIFHLPPGLQEAVASAYLCMRAVDEIAVEALAAANAATPLRWTLDVGR